jgi:4'-phosphopantetheinyl transferase
MGPAPPTGRAVACHRFWVRKEAWAKAHGLGVIDGLRVTAAPVTGPAVTARIRPAGAVMAGCRVIDVPAPDGYVAAVAMAGGRRARVTLVPWPGWPPLPGPARARPTLAQSANPPPR